MRELIVKDVERVNDLLEVINECAELIREDYNNRDNCLATFDRLVNELIELGYTSNEELKAGDLVVTNKAGQHHNVGKVYEQCFDGDYIVTFGGIYIAQEYRRDEIIKIGGRR